MTNCHIRAFSGIMTWPFAVLAEIVLAGMDQTTIVTPEKTICSTKPYISRTKNLQTSNDVILQILQNRGFKNSNDRSRIKEIFFPLQHVTSEDKGQS